MKNLRIKLSDKECNAIINGDENIAKTIAKKHGFVNATITELIDCGNFYRLIIEYEN